ncbi:MAG: 2-oxoglutarate dehydrogenase complex dihydrolipoyllysine-residue succinyltransferase [Phycisphaerales bacterium]
MAVDITMPQAGESVTSGVVSRWLKNDGEFVKRDEGVVEVETDKVTLEVPATATGVLTGLKVKPGDTVQIGQVLASIDEKSTAGAAPAPAAKASAGSLGATAVAEPKAAAAADVRATPLAKKLADEQGVDIARIAGTGAGGRVREQDVMAFLQTRGASGVTVNGPSKASAPAPQAAPATKAPESAQGTRGKSRERISPLRQRIAQRLVQAQHTAAMLTTFNECDMGAVMDLRKQFKDEFEKRHGIGLGFMGFFVKAVVAALRSYPAVNSYLVEDESGNLAVERHDYCDIAIAVSTPKGLVVPVLRNAETMSLAQVELGIKELAAKAKDGKLTLEDMQGGTFTITNGGVFGSLMSTPILNAPQSGILGMHTIKNRPIEHPPASGQIALRPMMYLAHSYDHRMIDGAEAVQFLVKVKQCIEDPQRLLLGL